jgi:hypothetical protein
MFKITGRGYSANEPKVAFESPMRFVSKSAGWALVRRRQNQRPRKSGSVWRLHFQWGSVELSTGTESFDDVWEQFLTVLRSLESYWFLIIAF